MLEPLFSFVRFTHAFQKISRVIRVAGEDAYENDAEHSYQLAMVAWYLIDARSLPFDTGKVLKLALVHDLAEIYAGDTFFYKSETEKVGKKEREAKAIIQIQKEFPEFGSLHSLIAEYEAHESPEARFIYALDKVLPNINIYLDDGRIWQEHQVTWKMLMDTKKEQVALSPEVVPYFNELMELLAKRPDLFPPE